MAGGGGGDRGDFLHKRGGHDGASRPLFIRAKRVTPAKYNEWFPILHSVNQTLKHGSLTNPHGRKKPSVVSLPQITTDRKTTHLNSTQLHQLCFPSLVPPVPHTKHTHHPSVMLAFSYKFQLVVFVLLLRLQNKRNTPYGRAGID